MREPELSNSNLGHILHLPVEEPCREYVPKHEFTENLEGRNNVPKSTLNVYYGI